MTRQQVENIVFMTHSPLTVDEVMKAIDEYAEGIRANERKRIVRKLEELKGTYFDGVPCEGTMIKINKAIEIVRSGENDISQM